MAGITLPSYPYSTETQKVILGRMLQNIDPSWDTTQGGFVYDSLNPGAIELAKAYIRSSEIVATVFAQTTSGNYLDLRCGERGVKRRLASAAIGTLRIFGLVNTQIQQGSIFSTQVDPTTNAAPITFSTSSVATIASVGYVDVPITCTATGAAGNVLAGAIMVVVSKIAGLTSVTNQAATTGGVDQETDPSYVARYLQQVQNPSSSGNISDYIRWSQLADPTVGNVHVVPQWDGVLTVKVQAVDTSGNPVSVDLLNKVQDYLDPAERDVFEAEAMTYSGYGVTTVTDSAASGGSAAQFAYNATGNGVATKALSTVVTNTKDGVWRARFYLKASAITGTANLTQLAVWNTTTNAACVTSRGGTTPCTLTLAGTGLSTAYSYYDLFFFWNGTDNVSAQITRLNGSGADTTTNVTVDTVKIDSQFGMGLGKGAVPIGAKVTATTPTIQKVYVKVGLSVASGYDIPTVKANVQTAIQNYLKSISLQTTNVYYSKIGASVSDTPGVSDYTNLQLSTDNTTWVSTNLAIASDTIPINPTSGGITWL